MKSFADHLLSKINKLEPWHVACLLAVVGLAVFFTGLATPFQNDDTFQIVNNPPVHSITNLPKFFQSGTYWDGQKLTGDYYRPMMTTTFSVIYTVAGAHPIAFHIVQLSLYITCAFLFYLVFKRFLNPVIVLLLTLIFLVHPLNSQIVYSIGTMQDVLFFFFGILAIWLIIRDESDKSLRAASGALLLSMFSKESGVVFIIISLLYLLWFNKKRVRVFLSTLALPSIIYLALRIHAVSIFHKQLIAPIDNVNFIGRLFNAPSILEFYISKLIFPWKLSTTHYWVYSKFSVDHFLIPLIVDAAAVSLFVYLGFRVLHKLSKKQFKLYLFFSIWAVLGILPYLQMVPLDMTLSETWFYFSFAGLLGMIGVALPTIKISFKPELLLVPVLILVGVFGTRTAVRGMDYRSQIVLSRRDIAESSRDYSAMMSVSQYDIDHGNYKEAITYAQNSINIYPVTANYNLLGVALEQNGDYQGAVNAYSKALKYGDLSVVYENLGLILIVYSDPTSTSQLFQKAINVYPGDFKIWLYLAIFEGANGANDKAKIAIHYAAKYGTVPAAIYNDISNDQPFSIPLLGKTLLIK